MSDNSSFLMPSVVYQANLSSASNKMFSDQSSRYMSQMGEQNTQLNNWRFLSRKIISKTGKVQQT
jgi:hypothetical protein